MSSTPQPDPLPDPEFEPDSDWDEEGTEPEGSGPRLRVEGLRWEDLLQRTQKGGLRRSLANVMAILRNDDAWDGVLAYDAFRETVITTSPPPTRGMDRPVHHRHGEWTEEDSIRTCAWLAACYELDVGPVVVEQAVRATSRCRDVHPVRDYLRQLDWDGQARIPGMLSEYFGATRNSYTEAVGTCWMISAVARVMRPGCKADSMLVFEGPQGLGKSSGLAALCKHGDWFADTGLSMGDKDSYQNLRGKWIYELAEMTSVRTARDVERVKAFLSASKDTYRPSYGRKTCDFPRQCVFAGSVNDREYLQDRTGNRRFWPVECGGTVAVDRIREDADQLWAETRVRYERGEPWYLTDPGLIRLAQAEQADRVQGDGWVPLVELWMENPTVPIMDDPGNRRRVSLSEGITTVDVLLGALRFRPAEIARGEEMRASQILRDLGFESVRVTDQGKRCRRWRLPDPNNGPDTKEEKEEATADDEEEDVPW